jgi:GT2 family glycosyltransferase
LLAQEYDLFLKLQSEGFAFQHLPHVLVSQNELVTSGDVENQAAIIEHLEQQGVAGVVAKQGPSGTRFVWPTSEPSVAVVIPTLNNRKLLEPLVDSLLHNNYRNLAITIVDNNSTDPATISYFQEIRNLPRVSVVSYNKNFNYSEAINLGAANSNSDLLLFLNDDIGVSNDFWLEELVQWATRPEIGVVGTKLIRANHTIQHAGIILGLNRFAGHIYLNAPEDYSGLVGSVDWYRNYMALTGACQMVRRDLFEAVGGYDEAYLLAFSDIDFCLKVYEKGYSNLYTPFASLFHYEGVSRGYNTPPADILRGYQRIEGYLRTGDPYFSEGLSFQPIPHCQSSPKEKLLKAFEQRKSRYQH